MLFFGYPIEVWIATLVAVFVKLQADTKLTLLGAATTFVTGVGSGIIFYGPLAAMFGLGHEWHVALACIIALTADNMLKVLLELSADRAWIGDAIKYWVTRKIDKDTRNDQKDSE